MTIGENMYLGNERGSSLSINWNETYGEADKYLKIVGLEESSRTLIKDIGVGKQQLVEIAKALAKNAKLLILDEPTAVLTPQETEELFDDGSHIIYVNGNYKGNDEIGQLMNDFRQTDSDKIHYAALAKGVKHFKDTEKGREQMCEAVEKICKRNMQRNMQKNMR